MVFVSFLPAAVCLFWFAANFSLARRTGSFGIVQTILAVLGVFFYSSATLAVSTETTGTELSLFFIRQFVTPMIIPLFMAYLRKFTVSDNVLAKLVIWTAIPVSLLFAEIVLLLLIGTPGCTTFVEQIRHGSDMASVATREMQLLYICCVYVFQAILAAEFVFLLIWTIIKLHSEECKAGDICKFLFKGEKASVFQLQASSIIFLAVLTVALLMLEKNGTAISWLQTIVSFLLAATVYIASFVGQYKNWGQIYWYDLFSGAGDRPRDEEDNGYQPETVRPNTSISPVPNEDAANGDDNMNHLRSMISTGGVQDSAEEDIAALNPEEEDSLRARFENLMVSEQLFLRQGIKISDIAAMLNTNRTYVSRLVNNTYSMSFSDYINTLRIDYAEQYLLHNRNAKQSDIAVACGFPNASSFNNIFKKITGVTPKIWLATRG